MKKLFYIAIMALAFVSCSDKVYEEINTDPTKADNVNPSSQLTYAALQMYGDMNFVDVYRLYTYAFTQHLIQAVGLGGAADELPDAGDILVEAVETLLLDDMDSGDTHFLQLVCTLLGNHRTADDDIRIERDNLLDVEVADAADALDQRRRGRIGAEVGASYK